MTGLYVFCAVLGGVLVLAQALFHHDDASGHDLHELHEGVKLPSLRALAAGVAFFGLVGGWLQAEGVWAPIAFVGASFAGGAIGTAVHRLIHRMARLERDASVVLELAVLEAGEVYIPIPPGGVGKILIALQGRTVELDARSQEARVLATGEAVQVVEMDGAVAVVRALAPPLAFPERPVWPGFDAI
jgi:hypothetical protein